MNTGSATIQRAHKIRLVPNCRQEEYLRRACGVRRLAFNWALATWNEQYEAHLQDKEGKPKPSWMNLQKEFNAIKDEKWPWIREISAHVPNHAIKDVGTAWKNFWNGLKAKRRVGKPRFAVRGRHERFYIHNQQLKCEGKRIDIGKGLGWIKMREELRFNGRIVSATISKDGEEWYISIQVNVPHQPAAHQNAGSVVGVDVGVAHLATTSYDTHVDLPTEELDKLQQRLKRQQRKLARCWSGKIKKGHADKALRDEQGQLKPKSNRFVAQCQRIGKLHRRIARIRQYALHTSTTQLVGQYEAIYIEDLNVQSMTRSAKGKGRSSKAGLNRVMLNSAVSEFRRQLTYKAEACGGTVQVVDPAYTSQTCCQCGHVAADNRPSQASFCCTSCGHSENADTNAAKNILKKGRGMCAPNPPRKRQTRVENCKTEVAPVTAAISEKRETHPISVRVLSTQEQPNTLLPQQFVDRRGEEARE